MPVSLYSQVRADGKNTDMVEKDKLPVELTETELMSIQKENKPRSHVEATLKISELRINNAFKHAHDGNFKSATSEIDVYASLIKYADAYTRKLPDNRKKDRDNCLKKIEQSIFKQNRTVDSVIYELPSEYRELSTQDIDTVKKIRLRAINDLVGVGDVMNPVNEQK